MSGLPPRTGDLTWRVRRRVARWAAPELDAELRATKRKLRAARAQLRRARAELRDAPAQAVQPVAPLPQEVEDAVVRAHAERLTYLSPANLRALAAAVIDAESRRLPGVMIEAGTARGGSAIVIAAAKAKARHMKVYDVFGMIPPPSPRDGPDVHARYERIARGEAKGVGGDVYYGYREDLRAEVVEAFARFGLPAEEHHVELIEGLFEDTINLDEPVAFAHLDGDWYESTMTCLTRIAPLLVSGGRIVLDDYYRWSGCRDAVDEYFTDRAGFRLEHGARLSVVRE